jgi:phosphatidyl-myo-inositol dimannoside synthase
MREHPMLPEYAPQAHQIPQLPVHLVTTDFPPSHGGLETYAAQLAANLEGICEVSAALGKLAPPLPFAAKAHGITWHWHQGRSRLLAGIWSAYDCAKSPQPHGARLHLQWNTALVSALQRRVGLLHRLFICAHGAEFMALNPSLRRLMLWIMAQADAVVTGSRFTANLLKDEGVEGRKVVVNPYGVNIPGPNEMPSRPTPSTQPTGDATLKLLCVHRLVARKGTALLLDALARHRGGAWHLTLAGEGPESADLKVRCEGLGLKPQVTFKGIVSEAEKAALFRESDLFLLPSLPPIANDHVEGLGLALLEAQAHELPVLAAETGGIPEALIPGKTGWLFQAGSCDDLSQTLGRLFHNHHDQPGDFRRHLKSMGQAGLGFVAENYAWERNFNRWRELLAHTI